MTPEQERALKFLRQAWPSKAAEIERLLAGSDPSVAAKMKISIGIRHKLEKFDGEWTPEKTPVEVIEGEDTIGDAP